MVQELVQHQRDGHVSPSQTDFEWIEGTTCVYLVAIKTNNSGPVVPACLS